MEFTTREIADMLVEVVRATRNGRLSLKDAKATLRACEFWSCEFFDEGAARVVEDAVGRGLVVLTRDGDLVAVLST